MQAALIKCSEQIKKDKVGGELVGIKKEFSEKEKRIKKDNGRIIIKVHFIYI